MRGSAASVAAALAALIALSVLGGWTFGRGFAEKRASRKEAQIRELAAALTRRTNEVEAVNKELEAFAYSVSHDLRAPLRHINGYVDLLSTAIGSQLGDEPRRYLGVIAKASQQMGDLIDDLLAFSRTTRADMHNTRIDLRAMVDAAIAGLEMPMQGRNIEWHIGALPAVEGDAAMVKVVYANLIGNAVKYTAPRDPARIEIGAAGEEDGRAVLFVRDNGVGFDMKYAGKLFGIFQRMHHPDQFEGTGIGLATVQRIVTRHGGRIRAESVPGEGTTFYFTLQRAISDPHAV
jgi:light-regulated signal transduction histidine kinase (bacteriophytochrome)